MFSMNLSDKKESIECTTNFDLKRIEVRGNTVFSQEKIESLIAPFLNKNLSFEQLRQITEKITDLYINDGYLTSGAFFPERS